MKPGRWTGFTRVDRNAVRAAILDGDALLPLAHSHPTRAAQLLQAAVIERHARPGLRGWVDDDGSTEVTDAPHWYAPLPERGPFLGFLNAAPEHALECIIGLVEHATSQSQTVSNTIGESDPPLDLVLDGQPVELVGDAEVMHWHRGDGQVPSVLASALMAVEAWLYRRLDDDEEIDDSLSVLMASRSVAIWGLLTEVAAYHPVLVRGTLKPLMTGGHLLLADALYRRQPRNYLLMPVLSDRAWAERIRTWHTMPHRSRSIIEILLGDVLSGVALVEELMSARERWRASDPEGLKHLIAQTDPANYRATSAEESKVPGWIYVPPAHLRTEIAKGNIDTSNTLLWIELPYRLREWIDARRVFQESELEQLWSELQELLPETTAEGAIPPIFAEGLRSRVDIECGFAALLVVCAPRWLHANPDRAAWCHERLLAPFTDPPPRHEFDFPGDTSTERWDMFCADAIPILWQFAPTDPALRRAIVRLATDSHRNTVSRVFSSIASMPGLGAELQQLETVALHWARFLAWQREHHYRRRYAEQGFRGGPSPDDLPDVETQTRIAIESFETGDLPAHMPRLAFWLAETPEGLAPVGRKVSSRNYALRLVDPEYLLAAFAHQLTLDEEPQGSERTRRLQFATDLANYLTSAMTADDGEEEVDGTPYGFERTAFDYLARVTVSARLDEARPIWEPLLSKGLSAGYWVEDFLSNLWNVALAPDQPPPTFATLIKEMIHFAGTATNWQRGYNSDLKLTVAGLGRWQSGPVHERHAALVEALQPEWGEWVRPALGSSWSARRAVYFCGEPGADRIHEQALTWLAQRERDAAPTDEDLDQALADMLLKLFTRHPNLFRGAGRAAADARLILTRLAARGDPIALELTSQLG